MISNAIVSLTEVPEELSPDAQVSVVCGGLFGLNGALLGPSGRFQFSFKVNEAVP